MGCPLADGVSMPSRERAEQEALAVALLQAGLIPPLRLRFGNGLKVV